MAVVAVERTLGSRRPVRRWWVRGVAELGLLAGLYGVYMLSRAAIGVQVAARAAPRAADPAPRVGPAPGRRATPQPGRICAAGPRTGLRLSLRDPALHRHADRPRLDRDPRSQRVPDGPQQPAAGHRRRPGHVLAAADRPAPPARRRAGGHDGPVQRRRLVGRGCQRPARHGGLQQPVRRDALPARGLGRVGGPVPEPAPHVADPPAGRLGLPGADGRGRDGHRQPLPARRARRCVVRPRRREARRPHLEWQACQECSRAGRRSRAASCGRAMCPRRHCSCSPPSAPTTPSRGRSCQRCSPCRQPARGVTSPNAGGQHPSGREPASRAAPAGVRPAQWVGDRASAFPRRRPPDGGGDHVTQELR